MRTEAGSLEPNRSRSIALPATAALVGLPYLAFAELNGWFNPALFQASPLAFWLVDSIFNVLLPLFGAWLLARFSGARPASYGLAFPPPLLKELLGATLFFGLVLFLAYFIPQRIAWLSLGRPAPSFSYGQVLPTGMLRILADFYLAVTAGLVESVVYIGLPWLLWRRLLGASRRELFCLASATLFASVHWEQGPHAMLGSLVFGYVACGVYLKIGDLWPIVGAHIAIDAVAFW